MASSVFDKLRQALGNTVDKVGTALNLGEGNISEKIAGGKTAYTGSNPDVRYAEQQYQSAGNKPTVIQNIPGTPPLKSTAPTNDPGNMDQGGGGGGGGGDNGGSGNGGGGGGGNEDAKRAMEEAARAKAEAERVAARGRYEVKAQAGEAAKGLAKDRYNWLTEALGTNKKTALEEVMLQEQKGVGDYKTQEGKTKENYSTAKQEILSTYRDLRTNQEKILRASGNQSSSRNREAQLKLNNLLGKDMSSVSKEEADSLSAIGNAISYVQEQSRLAQRKITEESKQKLDESALNYQAQIAQIDSNLNLAENEKADAYAQAEAGLANSIAQIEQWMAQVNAKQAEAVSNTKNMLDDYIVNVTDANGSLNSSLKQKEAGAEQVMQAASTLTPEANPQIQQAPQGGVYINPNTTSKDDEETAANKLAQPILGGGLISPEAASSAKLNF